MAKDVPKGKTISRPWAFYAINCLTRSTSYLKMRAIIEKQQDHGPFDVAQGSYAVTRRIAERSRSILHLSCLITDPSTLRLEATLPFQGSYGQDR